MKKKLLLIILSLVCITACALGLAACNFSNGGSGDSQGKPPQGVSYGMATVNYHYEYDVLFEHYREEKYSIQSGTTYELTDMYTPPMKAGYRFLGWTTEKGGAGEVIGSTYSIKGSGFGGTVYNFYAKYEAIQFDIVYHLDGGTNHPDNPTTLTGKQKLKKPTKEKYLFDGWYREPDFSYYTDYAVMTDDVTTTVNLYAKWVRVYEINYVSDQPGAKVTGDQSYRPHSSFTERDYEFSIQLEPEYLEDYLFLGWEVEAGGELVKEKITIDIDPKEATEDLTFTAHYLVASNPGNTPGLRTLISYGKHNFYARDEVTQIIVEDKYGSKYYEMTSGVTVFYSGEQPPEVICRDGITVYFEQNPKKVEDFFNGKF